MPTLRNDYSPKLNNHLDRPDLLYCALCNALGRACAEIRVRGGLVFEGAQLRQDARKARPGVAR